MRCNLDTKALRVMHASCSETHRSCRRVQEVVLGVGSGAGATQGVLGDSRATAAPWRGRLTVGDGGHHEIASTALDHNDSESAVQICEVFLSTTVFR